MLLDGVPAAAISCTATNHLANNSLLYVVAVGGNAGGGAISAIMLMAAAGAFGLWHHFVVLRDSTLRRMNPF
jgi:hypothetical protein